MALGPGKYDDLTTYVRQQTDAEAVIVIVLGGQHGSGFSVQALAEHAEQAQTRLPEILRAVAEQIEADALAQSHHHEANKAHEHN